MPMTKTQERLAAQAVRFLSARLIYNTLRGSGIITAADVAEAVTVAILIDAEVAAQAP